MAEYPRKEVSPQKSPYERGCEKCWQETSPRSAQNHDDVLSGLGFEQLSANVFVGRHAQHQLSSRNRRLPTQVNDQFLATATRQYTQSESLRSAVPIQARLASMV